ncbi:hypothetical protein BB560_003758, partial [Smittium megazygosporum]
SELPSSESTEPCTDCYTSPTLPSETTDTCTDSSESTEPCTDCYTSPTLPPETTEPCTDCYTSPTLPSETTEPCTDCYTTTSPKSVLPSSESTYTTTFTSSTRSHKPCTKCKSKSTRSRKHCTKCRKSTSSYPVLPSSEYTSFLPTTTCLSIHSVSIPTISCSSGSKSYDTDNPILIPCAPGGFEFSADVVSSSDIFVALTTDVGFYDPNGVVEVQFGISSGSNKIKNLVNAKFNASLNKRQSPSNIRVLVSESTITAYLDGVKVVSASTKGINMSKLFVAPYSGSASFSNAIISCNIVPGCNSILPTTTMPVVPILPTTTRRTASVPIIYVPSTTNIPTRPAKPTRTSIITLTTTITTTTRRTRFITITSTSTLSRCTQTTTQSCEPARTAETPSGSSPLCTIIKSLDPIPDFTKSTFIPLPSDPNTFTFNAQILADSDLIFVLSSESSISGDSNYVQGRIGLFSADSAIVDGSLSLRSKTTRNNSNSFTLQISYSNSQISIYVNGFLKAKQSISTQGLRYMSLSPYYGACSVSNGIFS